MFLANFFRFLLVVCLFDSIIFSPCSLGADADKDYEKHGKIIKPSYNPILVNTESQKGKRIFAMKNCSSCHSIDAQGGCLGPPLDGIGAYRSKKFLLARITNNTASMKEFEKMYGAAELMEHPRISAQDAGQVVQYLLTLAPPKAGFYVLSHNMAHNKGQKLGASITAESLVSKPNNDTAEGRKLFYEHGCVACHSINNIGGHFAPALDDINKRRSSEYISQRITNAEFFTQNYPDEYQARGMVMPPCNLTSKEIAEITNFLMSLH